MTQPAPLASSGTPPARLMQFAVAGALALTLIAGGTFWYAANWADQHRTGAGEATKVTVTGSACEPDSLTVPAGRRSFAITNASDRVLEWEILDGVMVVAERENIAPGMTATLAPRLEAGQYAITCGLLSNPHGTLVVTPSGTESHAPPSLVAFIGPLAEMKVELTLRAGDFVTAATALANAVEAGDLGKARAAYPAAQAAYHRIAATARRIGDLDTAIDAPATYFAGRQDDPQFTGLHRLEYGLFKLSSTDGLASVAARLKADSAALASRLADMKVDPRMLAADPADYMETLAQAAPGGWEPYAGTELTDIAAALAAVDKAVALLSPLSAHSAKTEIEAIAADSRAAHAALDALRGADGLPAYDTVDAATRGQLAAKLNTLGAALAALNAKLGLQ